MNAEQMEQQVSAVQTEENVVGNMTPKSPKKRRRRWGDRSDGRRLAPPALC